MAQVLNQELNDLRDQDIDLYVGFHLIRLHLILFDIINVLVLQVEKFNASYGQDRLRMEEENRRIAAAETEIVEWFGIK